VIFSRFRSQPAKSLTVEHCHLVSNEIAPAHELVLDEEDIAPAPEPVAPSAPSPIELSSPTPLKVPWFHADGRQGCFRVTGADLPAHVREWFQQAIEESLESP